MWRNERRWLDHLDVDESLDDVTSTTVATTTTTMPAPTTTTTDPDAPIDLVLQGASSDPFVLRPGRFHLHTVGGVPVELQFEQEGWQLPFIGERIIFFINERNDETPVAGLVMVVSESVEEIRDDIDSYTGSAPMTEPVEVRFGDQRALAFDAEIPVNAAQLARNACGGPSFGEERGIDATGTGSLSGAGLFVAQPIGCSWNRIWVIPTVDGSILALLGDGTEQRAQRNDRATPTRPLEPLEPFFEEFEAGITLDF